MHKVNVLVSSVSVTAIMLLAMPVATGFGQTSPRASKDQLAQSETVIRQTSPASCGPAVLATLFTFYFDDAVTESRMIELVGMRNKTSSTIKELQAASIKRGYLAEGFEMSLPELLNAIEVVGSPVIAHFKKPTDHYVLVVGQVHDFILISDPDKGQVSLHVSDFLRRWDNKVLVVTSDSNANTALIHLRRRSAETRLTTLQRANKIMSMRRF